MYPLKEAETINALTISLLFTHFDLSKLGCIEPNDIL